MIIVLLAGGLGNQMFRYAMGYAFAKRLGVPLRLDLSFFPKVTPPETPRDFELDRFNISGRPMNWLDKIRSGDRDEYPLCDRFSRAIRRLPIPKVQHFLDAGKGYDPAVESVSGHNFFNGDWQSEKYFAGCREDVLCEFAFRKPPDEENRAMINKMQSAPSVGVHVRRSDYTSAHYSGILNLTPVSYYERAIPWMQQRVPGANYFAFSDDPEWTRTNLPWPVGTTFVTHNNGKDNGEDLRLMSHCTHFITANSTFSWWGAWLGRAENKLVVAPRKWFASPQPSEADLVPASWNRL